MTCSFLHRVSMAVASAALVTGCGDPNPDKSFAAAQRYAGQYEFGKAVIEYKNALQARPDFAEARFAFGKALLDNGDAVTATVELGKAAALGYPADQVEPALAKAYVNAGQPRRAIELDAASKLQAPASVAALKTQVAAAHAALGDLRSAEAALARALELDPAHVPAQLLRARSMQAKGDIDAARRVVDEILARSPADLDAMMSSAQLMFSKGEVDAGIARLQEVLVIRPDYLPAHSALLEHFLAKPDLAKAQAQLDALKKARSRHTRTIYFDARLAAQQGDLKAADEHIKQLLKGGTQNAEVLHLAGVIALGQGELEQAEKHFNTLLQIVPEAAPPRQMLARVALRRGEPIRALTVLQPLLQLPRPHPTTLTLAGVASLQSGDAKAAEELFGLAAKQRPGDPAAATGLARARLARGDAGALDQLDSIAAADQGDTVDEALIAAYLSRRDFDGALKAADRLVGKQPGKPAPQHLRGQVLQARGDLVGARASYEKSLAADPNYFAAADALIALDFREDKLAQARTRINAALKANQKNSKALLSLAVLEQRSGKPPNEVAAALAKAIAADPADTALRVRLVDYHLEKRDFKAALAAARDASGALPNDAQVMDALARAQLATGEAEQAVSTYANLAKLRPMSAEPLLGLAAAQLAARNAGAALDAAKRALALAPDQPAANRSAVSAMLAAGKPDEAAALARSLARRLPQSALGDELLGDVERVRGQPKEAAVAYQAAMRKEPSSGLARKQHAALIAAGNAAQASALESSWLKQHPKDAGFLLHLGLMASSAQDYPKAELRYKQALELEPDNALTMNNLASAMHAQKKSGGLPYAERANQLRPGIPAYMDTLAVALADAGSVPKALEIQQQAVAKAPEDGELRLTLAKLHLQAGQREQARQELERLRALGDRFAKQREVQQMLAQP